MKKIYWKLFHSEAGAGPIFEKIDDLFDEIRWLIEESDENNEGDEITITAKLMTEEEYKNLPEHAGY